MSGTVKGQGLASRRAWLGRANRMRLGALMVMLVASAALSGCVKHIAPYKPKIRDYRAEAYAPVRDRRAEGSLWNESAGTLFTYRRAALVGDLITVMVKEQANASRDAGTALSRSGEASLGISAFGGLMAALKKAYPSVDPAKLLSAASKNDFSGKGQTSRSGKIEATITVRIKKLLPNGDFYIEGSKALLVNDEESHLYVSGVIRPSDVQADNSVLSDRVADMQVEYTGRGPVADKQKPGWFSRLMDWVSPF